METIVVKKRNYGRFLFIISFGKIVQIIIMLTIISLLIELMWKFTGRRENMRAINMYVLTRMTEKKLYSFYEKALSLRDDKIKVRFEEIEIIETIVANLKAVKAPFEVVNDWFYAFTIPQIGKEFDLLKLGSNGIGVNLEIKSQAVSKDKIEKQLKQNRYYLSHIVDEVYSFTYVKESEAVSKLYIYDGSLRESSFEELVQKLSEIDNPITQDIELLFRPKDYLVSPLNKPEKFLNGNYYLTAQQEEIKKRLFQNQICIKVFGVYRVQQVRGKHYCYMIWRKHFVRNRRFVLFIAECYQKVINILIHMQKIY